jgi:hypothetical protein
VRLAETATGTPPAPTCCAHGALAPDGGAGAIVKWQSLTRKSLGFTLPLSVAVVPVTPVGAAVMTVGAGSVQVNVTDGWVTYEAVAIDTPLTLPTPGGTPEEPPPPPPPPAS